MNLYSGFETAVLSRSAHLASCTQLWNLGIVTGSIRSKAPEMGSWGLFWRSGGFGVALSCAAWT